MAIVRHNLPKLLLLIKNGACLITAPAPYTNASQKEHRFFALTSHVGSFMTFTMDNVLVIDTEADFSQII